MFLNDIPILFILGPTAVGKTELALKLAQELNGEIVNADSRQVYRYMDIGTAKPTPAEQSRVPHHLLDLLPPDENFSLGSFLTLARQAIADISSRGRLPLVVGGTGQYLWALQEGWEVPAVAPDAAFRQACEAAARQDGDDLLYRRLQQIDPQRAAELDSRNRRRVIRALEIHHLTGRIPSSFRRQGEAAPAARIIGLARDREALYDRIDRRFDRMMADGLLSEARQIAEMGYVLGQGPLACPGYRELGQYLDGAISLDEAVQRAKYQTHRLARRQNTWFKPADSRICWLEADDPDLPGKARRLAALPLS